MEVAPTSRTLEVTVLSADNLCVDRSPVTTDAYVVVRAESIESFATSSASESTLSEGGGGRISWNEKLAVHVAQHARSITFEVKSKTAMGVVKNVGVARIAVSDVLVPEMLSYRLRDWEGRPSGVIHFEVKVISENSSSSESKAVGVMSSTTEKVRSCGFQMRDKSCNGVVVGMPVWWNNYTRSHF